MSDWYHRRSIRLRGYDYRAAGAYFVTICAKNRECLFGEIVGEEMRLNDAGRIVADTWSALPDHYSGLEIDAFVVMPNHVHGIIVLNDRDATTNDVGAGLKPAPTDTARTDTFPIVGAGLKPAPTTRQHALPEIVRGFKTFSSRHINETRGTPGISVWQRNYHEHIVRNGESLHRIRQYIAENPASWASDRENPAATTGEPEAAWWV